jgi:serralysin
VVIADYTSQLYRKWSLQSIRSRQERVKDLARDTYVVDQLNPDRPLVRITDDGLDRDWISFVGAYEAPTVIRLGWTTSDGISTSASALYLTTDNVEHRLVINGLIEYVRGSHGRDYVVGNEASNLVLGDQSREGPGDADTIFGGGGGDVIYGYRGADVISGGAAIDVLYGGQGADTIRGGTGADLVFGGTGADRLSGGGNNGDTLRYEDSADAISVVQLLLVEEAALQVIA